MDTPMFYSLWRRSGWCSAALWNRPRWAVWVVLFVESDLAGPASSNGTRRRTAGLAEFGNDRGRSAALGRRRARGQRDVIVTWRQHVSNSAYFCLFILYFFMIGLIQGVSVRQHQLPPPCWRYAMLQQLDVFSQTVVCVSIHQLKYSPRITLP